MRTSLTSPATADAQLGRRIRNFLLSRNVPDAEWLEVECGSGLVTLHGRMHSAAHMRLCLACCGRITGVVQIVDDLTVALPG